MVSLTMLGIIALIIIIIIVVLLIILRKRKKAKPLPSSETFYTPVEG